MLWAGCPVGRHAAVSAQKGSLTMNGILKSVKRFVLSEDGPTAVEYAVMLALILVACITIVTSLGTTVSGTFSKVNSTLSS